MEIIQSQDKKNPGILGLRCLHPIAGVWAQDLDSILDGGHSGRQEVMA